MYVGRNPRVTYVINFNYTKRPPLGKVPRYSKADDTIKLISWILVFSVVYVRRREASRCGCLLGDRCAQARDKRLPRDSHSHDGEEPNCQLIDAGAALGTFRLLRETKARQPLSARES